MCEKLRKQNCHGLSKIFKSSLPLVICTVDYLLDQVQLVSKYE